MGKRIPARYIGEHELVLNKFGGPYQDGDGKPLQSLVVRRGDTLLMNEDEVVGMTYLRDPLHIQPARYLGPGRMILPADQGKSDAQLSAIGYQFHEGRRDFEPVQVVRKAAAKDQKEG